MVAWRAGVPVRADQFLADVRAVAAALPAGAELLNLCTDRYRFTVGFGASVLAGKVCLLPPSQTPEVMRQLRSAAPDAFCLTDDPHCDVDLPQLQYPEDAPAPGTSGFDPPLIDDDRLVARLFTSGSTGQPLPYDKTWGPLARCARQAARSLGIDDRSCAMAGTVPPQHMFGFEATVLLPLQGGHACCAERPFHPADICDLLAALPRPRMLVTTPIHLRALLAAQLDLPAVDLILSSTAPLATDLAREVEARFDQRLLEIYGSTETGQVAYRRTAQTAEWQLCAGLRLVVRDGQSRIEGGHVEQQTLLSDELELTGEGRFLLHGRTADLVNIAGKRSSLAYLDHQLNAIPGVLDGAYYQREDEREDNTRSSAGITRLAAVVVAPALDAPALLAALRERIDPIFLPRPLLFVDKLPRNATGKLPRDALRLLVTRALERNAPR